MIGLEQAKHLTERLESHHASQEISVDLEKRFWAEFLPAANHWKTGRKLQLYAYQTDVLEKIWRNQRILIHWGRQLGKSMCVSLFLAFLTRWKPGLQALVLSFREDQSKLVLRMLRGFLVKHEDPSYAENIQFASAKHLILRNGGRVEAMPSGQVSRGFSPDVFVLDESELVNDSDLEALLPTKIATGAKQIFLGTSWSVDNFWFNWTTKPDEFGFVYSRKLSTQAIQPNGPVSEKDLQDLRKELDEVKFNQECLLIPLSEEQRWFPQELLAKVFTDEPYAKMFHNGCRLFVGVDPAVSGRDESVAYPLMVKSDGLVEGLPVLAWHNTPAPMQVQALKEFARKYEAYEPLFVLDMTGPFGITFGDLMRAAELPIMEFSFSAQSKAILYTRGKTILEDSPVRLRDPKTKQQLSLYHFRESETTKGRFKFGKTGIPDDRADALMLALWGLGKHPPGNTEAAVLFINDGFKPGQSFS